MAHPKFEIPADPHGKARYESAKLHAEVAKKAGKSSEEIHASVPKPPYNKTYLYQSIHSNLT